MINLKNEKQKLSFLRLRVASGVQGISTPVSCREAHKRRFLFNPWILRFVCTPLRMTIPVLAFLLTLNISTSRAATCKWKEGSTTELIVSGTGLLGNDDCPAGFKSTVETVTFAEGSNITSIGDNAFQDATGLTSIAIPEGVTSIGANAFNNTTNLTNIKLPSTLTSIGSWTFNGATGLTSITIPNSVTSIGNNAFYGASSLTSITIPDSVTSIGEYAFHNANHLTSITIPDSVRIGTNAFWTGTSFTDVNCIENENTTSTCANLKSRMKSGTASFNDDNFHIITEPTENCSGYSQGACSVCKSGYTLSSGTCKVTSVTSASCAADGKVLQGKECVSSCGASFRLNDGECDRIRYTPAEAAEVLRDDNTNEVTITFKK